MPIIAALLIALGGLGYAGYKIYDFVALHLSPIWGYGAVLLTIIILISMVFFCFQRYQRLHGKSINKNRILHETLSDGAIELEPNHKRGWLQTADHHLHFIFADIQQITKKDQILLLQLRDVAQPIKLAFNQENTAKLWLKRLQLATEQKL